jgi:hypothetical protein
VAGATDAAGGVAWGEHLAAAQEVNVGDGKRALQIGIAAAVAGLAWGYFRHRRDPRATAFAILQGFEWFVATGGAAALLELLRQGLEQDEDLEITERITHTRETVTDAAADVLSR